jgi:hypothetical protein
MGALNTFKASCGAWREIRLKIQAEPAIMHDIWSQVKHP